MVGWSVPVEVFEELTKPNQDSIVIDTIFSALSIQGIGTCRGAVEIGLLLVGRDGILLTILNYEEARTKGYVGVERKGNEGLSPQAATLVSPQSIEPS